jgi:urease accessory protein
VGKMPEPDQLNVLRDLWNASHSGEVGVTRLQQGILCRYRGPSSQAARKWFVAVWRALRPWYLQTSVMVPRVWGR